MFNSSVSTHVFQLLLCTLSTKLGYIIIVLKFSHFLKIYENSSPISANLAQCDLIRFSLFPQFYLPSMIVTSTQANCYHIVKSIRLGRLCAPECSIPNLYSRWQFYFATCLGSVRHLQFTTSYPRQNLIYLILLNFIIFLFFRS